jgi:signal peptidase I
VATYGIDSVSMDPNLRPSDRVMATPLSYGVFLPLSDIRFPGFQKPERGDLVVVQSPFLDRTAVWKRIAEPVVRFFTLQNASLYREPEGAKMRGYLVKRVVGLPGDTVRVKDFRVQVRPSGRTEFMSEEEASGMRYKLDFRFSPDGWTSTLPFSGTMKDTVLGPNEYFVLGDNRPVSSDSRSWGPVDGSHIMAKVFFRFWPLRSFGKL